MFGQARDRGQPDALRADVTLRQVADPAPGEGRGATFRRRSTIVVLALACHFATLAGIDWLERANPPEDAGGAVEIPVEMVAEPPQEKDIAAQNPAPPAPAAQQPPSRGPAPADPAPQNAPAAAQDARRETPSARPSGVIVERPTESSLPQEARTRGAKADAQTEKPPEDKPQPAPEQKQMARANPFGDLSPAPRTPEPERAPIFLAPQSFIEQARPRPAPDPTNDNYRARALGQVAAAMLEPERPRPKALAIVGFTIDDAGGLVSAWLARPSGHADLDAEALDMVRRAAPFPPPPARADRNFAAAIAFGGD